MGRILLPLLALILTTPALVAQSIDRLTARQWTVQSVEVVGRAHWMPSRAQPVPWMRFTTEQTSGDTTRWTVLSGNACNGFVQSWRSYGGDSIALRIAGGTLRLCPDGIIEFEEVLRSAVSAVRHFTALNDRAWLWSADSSVVLHLGIAAPSAYGPRLQLVNLIPGASGVHVWSDDESGPILRADSTGRTSPTQYFGAGTRRLVATLAGQPHAASFLDTTLAAGDTGSYLLIAHRDMGGAPTMSLVRRTDPSQVGSSEIVRVVHLAPELGDVAMRLESFGAEAVQRLDVMRYRDAAASEVPSGQLRLKLATLSDGRVRSYRHAGVFASTARQFVIVGSGDTGVAATWDVRDAPVTTVLRADLLERGTTGFGARMVNLTSTAIGFTSAGIPRQTVPPLGVSMRDDDVPDASLVVLDDGDGPDTLYTRIDPGGTGTIALRFRSSGGAVIDRTFPERPRRLVAADSALVRFVVLWPGEIQIGPPTGGGLRRVTDIREFMVPVGASRFTMRRECACDTPDVWFDVPLAAGSLVTVLVHSEGDRTELRLLHEWDLRARAPLPLLGVTGFRPPEPYVPLGALWFANLTTDASAIFGSTRHTAWTFYGDTTVTPSGPVTGTVTIEGTPQRTLEYEHLIIADTTLALMLLGDGDRSPYRLLRLFGPKTRDTTRPWLRIVNALDDVLSVDVNASPEPYAVPERRAFRDEAIEHRPARLGPLSIEVQQTAGPVLFHALDTLHANHRYTAVITGRTDAVRVFLIDEELETAGSRLRTFRIVRPEVSGVESSSTGRASRRVTPNPARDRIVLSLDGRERRVRVLDLLGREVASIGTAGSAAEMALDAIEPGHYTFVAHDGERALWTERIVVVR